MANENRKSSFKKIFTFVNLKNIPGPRGLQYLRYVKLFQKNILSAFTQTYTHFGPIVSYPWPMNSIIIYSPKLIKSALVTDHKSYIKGEQIEEIRAVVGNGLATNNNHKLWLRNRAIVSKAFTQKAIKSYSDQINHKTRNYIKELKLKESVSFDICEDMKYLTFEIACQMFLGNSLSKEESKKVNQAVDFTSIVTYERIFEFFPLPYWIPTKKHRMFKHHYNNLKSIVSKIIRESNGSGNSVLDRLINAKDPETGQTLTNAELRDELFTLLIAGHETSAHTLTWIIALLAKHQDIQEKLYNEIIHVDPNHELPRDLADICPYLKNVINESMRLYPAFPVLSRKACKDTTIGEYKIQKNTNVVIPIYVTHRSDEFWEDPLKFNPDRFKDESLVKSFKFLPFSKGSRRCIGEALAVNEIALILINFIKEYKVSLTYGIIPDDLAHVSLKPDGGLPVKITSRL